MIIIGQQSNNDDIYWTTWWRDEMEIFSALPALCEGNPPVTGGFPYQGPVTRCFDLRLNKRLSKQLKGRWFETPSRSLWRHCNEMPRNKWPKRVKQDEVAIITIFCRQDIYFMNSWESTEAWNTIKHTINFKYWSEITGICRERNQLCLADLKLDFWTTHK